MLVTTDHQKLQEKLSKVYQELTTLPKQIVQLLAVNYGSMNRTQLLACLNQIGVRDQDNKKLVTASLNPYVNKLLSLNVLIQERQKGPQCHPLLLDIVLRELVAQKQFEKIIKVVHKQVPVQRMGSQNAKVFRAPEEFIREIRIGFYRQDLDYINDQISARNAYSYYANEVSVDDVLLKACTNPFDPDWFRMLPLPLYETVMGTILDRGLLKFEAVEGSLDCLQDDLPVFKPQDTYGLQVLLLEHFLWQGCVEEAQALLVGLQADLPEVTLVYQGWLAFLRGDDEGAIATYTQALKAYRKVTGKRKAFFNHLPGLFLVLALIRDGSPPHLQQAKTYAETIARQNGHWLRLLYSRLVDVICVLQGDLSHKPMVLKGYIPPYWEHHSIGFWIHCFCLYWVDTDAAQKRLTRILNEFCSHAMNAGYHWLAMESAELLGRMHPEESYSTQAEILRADSGIVPLVDVIRPRAAWELTLDALIHLQTTATPATSSEFRLVWWLTYRDGSCTLEPREQKLSVKGNWTKGRVVSIRRLATEMDEYSYLTPQDRRVCSYIESYSRYSYGYYGSSTDYEFSPRALLALVGHPLVFWADATTTAIELVKGEPELVITQAKNERLTLQFRPPISDEDTVVVQKESPTRLKVIDITAEHHRIAEILGAKNQLSVPASAKEQVLAAINSVSSLVTVHSDIGGGVAAEEVPPQTTPHIHLLPAGTGLKVAVLARPFGSEGPYYRPGTGGETIIAEIDGQRLQTTRDLKDEKQQAKAAIQACPTLEQETEYEGEWLLEEPETCLELLLELQALGDSAILEWPEGEKMRIAHQAGTQDFRMQLQRQRDWFAASGELQLDDERVMDMQTLLALLEKSPGRFIQLGDGQFLALTNEFRKRLDELRAYSEKHGKGVRFHPLASLALEDTIEGIGQLKADKHWKAHTKKLKEMQDLEPQLPSTLQAELRDYQVDGFNWLARLAHWEVGACLADDMGLGKTLQALAVILTRAPTGPTLVVAPTSVGMNWLSEAAKFAPTLKPLQLGTGNRQQMLDALAPFDLLVCSYGLLQQEEVADMLAKVEWQTIVLDEAQAIKNMATKRSQAAMNLQAGFKIITTGTPIENHLGELWNLFRFINPGLLGSLERFNEKFANPIERYQDRAARNRLKKLIQPFLLRRTKNQVLSELPSRTEITLQVELSADEMALYEALRREAVTKLTESDAEAGAKHLQVLAEIMRLRRACCNPQLVMPKAPPPSAKLQVFGEVLTELLDNRHKALVFSQFVDHLHILRDYLDEQKIAYQYLDGSTPAKQRKKRVDAFQSGEGDVFLISLKAGGTGLNLTAADYVIHMDPWWNPAVEDQASDRAHRIGQRRPVTIYRLVAKGTIEEKIVDLHQQKRDLADSLLEGTDMSGKISTEQLLQLISEG